MVPTYSSSYPLLIHGLPKTPPPPATHPRPLQATILPLNHCPSPCLPIPHYPSALSLPLGQPAGHLLSTSCCRAAIPLPSLLPILSLVSPSTINLLQISSNRLYYSPPKYRELEKVIHHHSCLNPCMIDPETDHGFVYTEEGITNIERLPFFDIYRVIDVTIDGYIQRLKFTLSIAIEEHLGVYDRLLEYADTPLHPSYTALQTLYRVDGITDPIPTVNPAEHLSLPSGNLTVIRYFGLTLL